ncbi:MAG: DUF4040 domain-containing protein, partial [Deltaproteobacteria bacterium]
MLGLVVAGATATLWLSRHVLAVIALTISGYSLAIVFALMHAPDVALAQVLVETLATLSIVMALRQSRLVRPQYTKILTAGKRDWGRWVIAAGSGLMVASGVMWVTRDEAPSTLGA